MNKKDEYNKRYRDTHRLEVRKRNLAWYHKNRDKVQVYRLAYDKKTFARRSELGKLRQQKYKKTVMDALGGKCVCCGELELDFLTLEHIQKDGQAHRATGKNVYLDVIKQGFPREKYTVLCMNCNFVIRFGKKCPHQRTLLEMVI